MKAIFNKASQLFFGQTMQAQQTREEDQVSNPVKAYQLSIRL